MIENISNIKLKIEELSTLLGFFKQKSIKQILYKNIEETESTYQNIENSLENIQNEYKDFKLRTSPLWVVLVLGKPLLWKPCFSRVEL